MILREKILKLINKHFQEKTGLDYAVDNFEELILEERKFERERIKKIIIEAMNKEQKDIIIIFQSVIIFIMLLYILYLVFDKIPYLEGYIRGLKSLN